MPEDQKRARVNKYADVKICKEYANCEVKEYGDPEAK
jgi:hypothetical protein